MLCTVLKEMPKADGAESLASDLLSVTSSLLLHSSDRLSVEVTARLMALVSATCLNKLCSFVYSFLVGSFSVIGW